MDLNVSTSNVMVVSGLELAEITYGPRQKIPRHSHEKAHFCLVLQGNCNEVLQGKVGEFRPGTLSYLPPSQFHSMNYLDSEVRWFCMEIQAEKFKEILRCLGSSPKAMHSRAGSLNSLFLRLYKEYRLSDEVSPLAIEGLVLEMFAELFREQTAGNQKRPYRLLQVKELLDANLNQPAGLSSIAESVRMHPTHLAREFRRHFGMSIGEYVRGRRLEFARHQVATSDAPFVEIANAAGFCDQSHFARSFKRSFGMTPTEYRNSLLVRPESSPSNN